MSPSSSINIMSSGMHVLCIQNVCSLSLAEIEEHP